MDQNVASVASSPLPAPQSFFPTLLPPAGPVGATAVADPWEIFGAVINGLAAKGLLWGVIWDCIVGSWWSIVWAVASFVMGLITLVLGSVAAFAWRALQAVNAILNLTYDAVQLHKALAPPSARLLGIHLRVRQPRRSRISPRESSTRPESACRRWSSRRRATSSNVSFPICRQRFARAIARTGSSAGAPAIVRWLEVVGGLVFGALIRPSAYRQLRLGQPQR
jgi:hypothetical protein